MHAECAGSLRATTILVEQWVRLRSVRPSAVGSTGTRSADAAAVGMALRSKLFQTAHVRFPRSLALEAVAAVGGAAPRSPGRLPVWRPRVVCLIGNSHGKPLSIVHVRMACHSIRIFDLLRLDAMFNAVT